MNKPTYEDVDKSLSDIQARIDILKGQSHKHSIYETITSTSVGFLLSLAITYYVLPYWGYDPSPRIAIEITLVHTVASLIRGYVLRRIFNARNHG